MSFDFEDKEDIHDGIVTARERARKQLGADAQELLKLAAGRRFLRWLESLQPVGDSTYTGNANSYRLEGRREITREVRRILEDADPTLIPWIDRNEEEKK